MRGGKAPIMASRDTIVAISTAAGRAAVGIVRVSGPEVSEIAGRLIGRLPVPREATLITVHDAAGEPIDQGIALYYPAPRSYTGEDVLELQGHGGPVVLGRVLQRCLDAGARLAEPGEFTRRAFLNGKLDLVQAEGVIDLIDATTAQAARSAMRSLQGEFSAAIDTLASELVEVRVLVEAMLDFPEEELDGADRHDIGARLVEVRAAVDRVLEAAQRGSLLREGVHVVLAGQPNVGKSSLLNRLAGEDVAIVTDVPGTTRDAIRQVIDVGGVPAHIVDTAGLREPEDPVERIGVERAWRAIERADIVLHLVDAGGPAAHIDDAILERLPPKAPRITVMNKIDLIGRAPGAEHDGAQTTVWLSAKTGAGIDLLRQALLNRLGWHERGEGVFLARERHLRALAIAKAHLAAAPSRAAPELVAEELRLAHEALGAITGEFSADDLLGEVFQRFCIGK
jgi:tRNA modification GTPase